MRTLKLSLFASAMLLGSFTMTAQNADEIMSKHIAAIGGADNWKKINSIKKVSSATMQGMEMEMTETIVKGKGMRTDIAIMGTDNYTIITPSGGWNYMPAMGATKAEEIKAEDLKDNLDVLNIVDELISYKEDGIKAEYVSKEDIEGKSAHKIKLTDKDGTESNVFIDAATFYKVRESQKVEMQGQKIEIVNDYSDFKKLPEGIVLAMKVSNMQGDQTIKSVEINKPVDDSAFKPSN